MKRPNPLLTATLLTSSLVISGCTAVQFKNKYIEAPGIVRLHIESVDTYEKRRWILGARLENTSDQQLIVQLRDVRCYRGETEGEVEYRAPFGIGERSIDLKPGETKRLDVKCLYPTMQPPPEGTQVRLHILRVFEDKTGAGHAVGAVLARDLEWKYPSTT